MLSNRVKKQVLLLIIDVGVIIAAFFLAVFLRFEGDVSRNYWIKLEGIILPAVLITLLFFIIFGLYRTAWRYASVDEMMSIVFAVSASLVGIYSYSYLSNMLLPRSIYVIFFFLLLVGSGSCRLSLRLVRSFLQILNNFSNNKKGECHTGQVNPKDMIIIFGAGDAGVMIAQELKKHVNNHYLVGFVDDDLSKHRQFFQGLPVLGTREDIPAVVKEKGITEVVIAIPSASYKDIKNVVNICLEAGVRVKTMPGLYEILDGQASFTRLREFQIEDLLKREQVKTDISKIAGYLDGETVLITGAGGSIGSELCRQVVRLRPAILLLFDRDENNLFYIHRELEMLNNNETEIHPLLGDIQDYTRLEQVFNSYKPGVVFHAAAYKHVPLIEYHVDEAVKNNIFGSKNVVDLSTFHRVKRFVLVSTDKAVKPSSVMGATKRAVEIYIQILSKRSNTLFCAVRFGNVLASRGSVVPIFKEQIEKGGPVTVTHPEMIRYFMTIPEAVQLIIQSGAMIERGEIFILDMGEPVKILDLARDMIMLSGLKPGKDIEIKFTGIRPGEKLYEELLTDKEAFTATQNERIFIARNNVTEDALLQEVKLLQQMLGNNFNFFQEKPKANSGLDKESLRIVK